MAATQLTTRFLKQRITLFDAVTAVMSEGLKLPVWTSVTPTLVQRTEPNSPLRTACIDEMTGIQALERQAPNLPLRQGLIERQEFECIRHGTQTLIASFDVVSGQVIHPTIGDTRTEVDYVAHVRQTIATDPDAKKWHAYYGLFKHPSIRI